MLCQLIGSGVLEVVLTVSAYCRMTASMSVLSCLLVGAAETPQTIAVRARAAVEKRILEVLVG